MESVQHHMGLASRHGGSLLMTLIGATSGAAWSTEGGGSIYPMGVENYALAALPPPGWYAMVYPNHYDADTLRDNSGNADPIDFKVSATALAPRLIWSTGEKLWGGDLVFHAIVPLVSLDVDVGSASVSKTGLGDIIFGFATGYHHSPNLHSIVAFDGFAPTGRYNSNDVASIGRNYWAVQPIWGITRVAAQGLNGDLKLMYTINFENGDTNYRSGRELHFDYSLGWAVNKSWVLGIGGYGYRQVSDDRQNGATVPDNRGRAFAVGPSIKYDSGKGWFFTAKYQIESEVRNRSDGAAFWMKIVTPL